MSLLLTYSQQQAIKAISANNAQKYTLLTTEVEKKELPKLLGVYFVQKIQATPGDYADLLNGCEFTDGDNTVRHEGIRYIIAYMNYSKYLGESFVNDTFTGFVKKTRVDSEVLSEGQIRRLQEENRAIALQAWEVVKRYLDLHFSEYPLWNSSNVKKVYRHKIYGIKKTLY